MDCRYQEAIKLLKDVLRLAPNLSDPYHTLGRLHEAAGDTRTALDFYMLAAHLTPKVRHHGLVRFHSPLTQQTSLVLQSSTHSDPTA